MQVTVGVGTHEERRCRLLFANDYDEQLCELMTMRD